MFGYIKTYRPELKVREDETYKGVYCSLCRELGKRYGVMSRMFLSYDAAFLACALMATDNSTVCFEKKRCPFNPSKKCQMCKDRPSEITYAADISVILLHYKIKDNIHDSSLFKAVLYKIILLLTIHSYKKAKRNCPDGEMIIGKYIDSQIAVEKKQSDIIDEAAEPTAEMLSQLFLFGCTDEDQKKVRKRIGYCLGRWIYLIDAFDDIEKDRKSGNYNPFIQGGNDNYEKIKGDLLMTAGEAAKAYELLNVKKFNGIVHNVIYDGLYYQTLKVYEGRLQK